MSKALSSGELRELFAHAERNGFATGYVRDKRSFERLMLGVGLSLVSNRSGTGLATMLRVLGTSHARPGSMSQTVGMEAQPLHTDGAHLHQPPNYVVLVAETPNETPTRFWQPSISSATREDLSHGMFKVSTGPTCFLSSSMDQHHLRYDPVCMQTLDARAREAARVLTPDDDDGAVSAHSWTSIDANVLILNNRTLLHGRAEMTPGDDSRELARFSVAESSS